MKEEQFILYPAIDIKEGKCVRLLFGDMKRETVYNNNPIDPVSYTHLTLPTICSV